VSDHLTSRVQRKLKLDIGLVVLPADLKLLSDRTFEFLKAFLAEYNLTEPAAPLLTRLAYEALDLISFFTMGEDEVRAWPIVRGSNAVTAAGKIHSDLARGFIRAEVIPWKQVEGATDMKSLKAASHADLMGKEYVVQDGDILNIRFSV